MPNVPSTPYANAIQLTAPTGLTLYAVAITPSGLWWNTGTRAAEAFNSANWSLYVLTLTEAVPNSGLYFSDIPLDLTAGLWLLGVYQAVTATPPASTDPQYPTTDRPLVLSLDWCGYVKSLSPIGSSVGPLDAQPQTQNSAVVAQRIVNALYAARLTLASQTVATVNVDGTVTTFTNPADIDAAISYWERKAALLSGRRRRVQSIRLDRW